MPYQLCNQHNVYIYIYIKTRDGTKPIPSTGVNFKVSVSPKNAIPIPSTYRYFSDTLHPIIMMSCNEIQKNTIL